MPMHVKNQIPATAFFGKDPDDRRRNKRARFGQVAIVSDGIGKVLVGRGHKDVTPADEPADADAGEGQ